MKKRLFFIIILMMVLLALGCSTETKAPDGNSDVPENVENSKTEKNIGNFGNSEHERITETDDKIIVEEPENDAFSEIGHPVNNMIFDFAELPEETFPRGLWSVNQLIQKYGEPVDVWADYWADYWLLSVRLEFSNMHILFNILDLGLDSFSFYKEDIEDGRYELNENDKNLVMDILGVSFNSEDTQLPYGITIGKHTKSQIKALYPKDTYYYWIDEKYGMDMILYFYGYADENGKLQNSGDGISYYFDENEVLVGVTVKWYYTDI